MPPDLSVVIACYRMAGQIGNTLRSLLPPYQQHVLARDYEILLVDNGSPEPLADEVWQIAENIRYTYVLPELARPSPAAAINAAVARARGSIVGVMIDGARMVTPGVLYWGQRLARTAPRAAVDVRGWHLGFQRQNDSIRDGYGPEAERRLLASVRWPENGYRLFQIAAPTFHTRFGFSGRANESNCVFLARELFQAIGGLDERYSYPGGGVVNLDFFWRVVTAAQPVFTLLGEGNFHQVHGGAATGLTRAELARADVEWWAEYERLSRPRTPVPPYDPILAGHIPREAQPWMMAEAA